MSAARRDLGTALREARHQRSTETIGSAGHDDDFVLQVQVHVCEPTQAPITLI